MKKFFNLLWKDKITYWGFLASILFILTSFILIVLFYQKLPPFLPLYNKLPWGYSRIGRKIEIFIYFGLACIIFILNLILSAFIYKRIVLLARFLCMTTVIISLFVLIFTVQIIMLMK